MSNVTQIMNADLNNLTPRMRSHVIGMRSGGLSRSFAPFRKWRTLRWFLLASLPGILGSTAALAHGHGFCEAGGLWLIGFSFLVALFQTCCSGMAILNLGTFMRTAEPVRFWATVLFLAAVYLLFCAIGFFW